jgi:hypothetical protein
MYDVFSYRRCAPSSGLCFVLLWFAVTSLCAETKKADPESQGFLQKIDPYWSFLWTGSWEVEGNLINRGDLRFHIPWDCTFRTQFIDKRPLDFSSSTFWEDFDRGNSAFSTGLYHKKTSSRILYGILDEWGLPARIRKPWIRSIPFVEYHKPAMRDLKTEPSATQKPETYLYLGSPQLGIFKGFASVGLNDQLSPAFTGGLELQLNKKTDLRIEGFYTSRELPPRTSASWFSESPPLPERNFHLYALGFVYQSPFWGIATDWAYSDTFAYGRDLYGNLGIRIGNRPWQVSLAADGAGNRYVGRDGSATGPGFRLGARIERYGTKNSLFRTSASLRSSGLGEPFERSSTLVYYRFPSNFGRLPVRPSRVSLTLTRNASNGEKIEDTIEGVLGLNWRNLRSVCSGALTGISAQEDPLPFPFPEDSLNFSSVKISEEVSYSFSIFQFKTKLGYTFKQDKEPVWDTAFQVTLRGKPGRFSLKIASPEFPHTWTGSLSWRLEKK